MESAKLKERNRELAVLNSIALSINRRLDLRHALESSLSEMRSLVPFGWAGVILLDERDGALARLAAEVPGTDGPVEAFRADGTLPGYLREKGMRSSITVPLVAEGCAVGSLVVACEASQALDAGCASIIREVADHLAVAVSNARLHESLRKRTEELEVLVRETHHRIQNNLQMIAGLVSMIGADSESSRRGVARCLNQIKAVSVIHEMLSCGGETGLVELKQTIKRLAEMSVVAASYGREIKLEVLGEEICLQSKCATAVGIAVNELVTNAIEHGFAGREKGRITIEIRSVSEHVEVLVRDDGIGLPGGFKPQDSKGLGLKMIGMLLKQGMGGDLTLESGDGTVARIFIRC